jgi:DNA processing protein
MDSDHYLGWLALALTPGLGARTAELLREFGSPEAIFAASLTALEAHHLPAAVAKAIHTRQPLRITAKELTEAQALGGRLRTSDEPEYPSRLREMYDPDPPVCLWQRLTSLPPFHRNRWLASSHPLRESNG